MPSLTREELYALLWTEPVSKVAARHGISDRGLGKLCEREGIPVPPRGWWAKKATGKRVKQPELPPWKAGWSKTFTFAESKSKPEPPAPAEAPPEPPEILFERQPENEIAVEPEARVTHPLVRDAGIGLRKATPAHDGIRQSPRGCLDIRVSRDSIQRALLIMQALLRALEKRGYAVEIKDGKTLVSVLGEPLRIYLREAVRKEIRELTGDERERRRQGHDVNPYRVVPAGTLGFYEGHYSAAKSTADNAKRRLEDALNVFIESLVREAYREKALRVQREREAEERRIAEEKRKQDELVQRHELAKIERFDALVDQWQAAEGRRAFVAALRESIGDAAEGSPLSAWLRWAEHYIEVSDPLTRFRNRKATITLFYNASRYTISEIRAGGFKDEVPHVGYGEKPKAPGAPLSDVPQTSAYGSEALELVLAEDAVLPYEITNPGFVPRRFCVPAGVLNALLKTLAAPPHFTSGVP
jgi:hypothetical protein